MDDNNSQSIPWMRHFQDIEKHLDINEKYFRAPEGKMMDFEKNMDDWNVRFTKNIEVVDQWMEKFKNKMESFDFD